MEKKKPQFKVKLEKRIDTREARRKALMDVGLQVLRSDELQFEQQLGAGAFGRVDLVSLKAATAKKRALKNISGAEQEEVFQRFMKELRVLSTLSHPNVVSILGAVVEPLALMLEYVVFDFDPYGIDEKVTNLSKFLNLLHQCSAVMELQNEYDIMRIVAKKAAEGLSYLHENGIAHRDLKPSNILVTNTNEYGVVDDNIIIDCKITDFGEARSSSIQTKTALLSRTANVDRGTIPFQAPEVILEYQTSASLLDLKMVDIWAYGCILFCLLNPGLEYPFHKEFKAVTNVPNDLKRYIASLLDKRHLPENSEAYSKLRETLPDIERVMMQCLSFVPTNRPAFNIIMERYMKCPQSEEIAEDVTDGRSTLAVVVKNIPPELQSEYLELWFESERRSGGGLIETFYCDELETNRSVTITYTSGEVAKRVAQTQQCLSGTNVSVELLVPTTDMSKVEGCIDDRLVLVTNIPVGSSEIDLQQFLSCNGTHLIDKVDIRTGLFKALVKYTSPIDFVKVRDYIGPRPFRGNMISLQQVGKTNVMCARGFQNLDELIIKYYFESPSNGGGRIVKYESNVNKGYMLVHFEENSVLNRVLERTHLIKQHHLQVSSYYECLGIPVSHPGGQLSIQGTKRARDISKPQTCVSPSDGSTGEGAPGAKGSQWSTSLHRGGVPGFTCEDKNLGVDRAAFKVAHHITTVQPKLEEELDRVTDRVTLKGYQFLMLQAIRFDLKEKEVLPDIDIRVYNKEITFTGLPNVITSAKLHMYEILNSIVSDNNPSVPESICRLLKKKPVRDHLVNHFKGKNMRMTWDAGKKDLTVYALTVGELKIGVSVLTQEVIEAKIDVGECSNLLHTGKWNQMRESLLSKYPDALEINICSQTKQIKVAAINHQCNLVIEDITTFLSEYKILAKAIEVDRAKYKFIRKAMTRDISNIVSYHKSMKLDIQFKIDDDKHYLIIKGNKFGMPTAEKKVNDLIAVIKSRDHDINKPGMNKYFGSQRGQDFMVAVESRHSVSIQLITEGEEKDKSKDRKMAPPIDTRKDKTVSKARLKNGTEVFVCNGDLTTYKVGAIVNAANEDLAHVAGLSLAIVQKGGKSIQDQCNAYIRKCGKILPGQMFVSDAGNLPCQKIIHAVGPKWQGGRRQEQNIIYDAIYECLTNTVANGLSSVALPALSAGVYGVPLNVSTRNIVTAVKDFCENETSASTLTKVYFVDNQQRTVDAFHKSLQLILGDAEVELVDNDTTRAIGMKTGNGRPVGKNTKLRVCARSTQAIDAVMREIEERCNDECKDKVMDSKTDQENIAKLSEVQIARIQSLDQTCAVKITIEIRARIKRIRLQGNADGISRIVDKIYAIFMENSRKEHERFRAELVGKQVQWYFEDGPDMEEYPGEINSKIEYAFNTGRSEIEWTEADGEKFKIKFKAMVEVQNGRAGASVKVHRKTKGGSVELPPSWTPMDPSKDFELVGLPASSSEYQEVARQLKASAGGHVNSIISIERVQNASLFQKYSVHKDSMMKANPTGNVENMLWHGISVDSVESINRYGFNRSYCGKNATALGNGVYFAKNAGYSCSSSYARPDPTTGHKHIHMCQVLTGEYAHGASGMRVAPAKSGTILYDSVVDNVSSPSIYVVFTDTQAYPEYHITFS